MSAVISSKGTGKLGGFMMPEMISRTEACAKGHPNIAMRVFDR